MEKLKEMSQNGNLIDEKFIVEYEKEFYDITEFMLKHPGGINTLNGYNHKKIDQKFHSVEHSSAARYLLNDYKISRHKAESNNNNVSSSDDNLEQLIDWNSALIPQIWKLGDKYTEWVNMPVDRHMTLFSNPLLESLSKTPWYLPPVFWIPVIIYLTYNESQIVSLSSKNDINSILIHLVIGVFLWTLVEYTLHRFLFHMNVVNRPTWSTFHFLLHGLHHKVPFDENRLVFPPVPAAILATIIYQPVHLISLLFGNNLFNPRLILAGGLIGYLCYDMIHYYIHYGSPSNKYFYHLKRYHYNHHFVNHDQGFGISSPAWDEIFGTKIILKKLKYFLKW